MLELAAQVTEREGIAFGVVDLSKYQDLCWNRFLISHKSDMIVTEFIIYDSSTWQKAVGKTRHFWNWRHLLLLQKRANRVQRSTFNRCSDWVSTGTWRVSCWGHQHENWGLSFQEKRRFTPRCWVLWYQEKYKLWRVCRCFSRVSGTDQKFYTLYSWYHGMIRPKPLIPFYAVFNWQLAKSLGFKEVGEIQMYESFSAKPIFMAGDGPHDNIDIEAFVQGLYFIASCFLIEGSLLNLTFRPQTLNSS